MINPEWRTLLRGNPDVHHVHIFPRSQFRGLAATGNIVPWLLRTRALQPDVALDFQGLLRSALIAKISRAGTVYGLSDGREGSRWFYDHVAEVDRGAHAVERYLKLAEAFGAPPTDTSSLRFRLPSGDALPRFDPDPPFVLLHPFARGRGKSLSTAVIAEFCRALAPMRIVIVGRSGRKLSVPDNCINLTNETSLLQLIWLIRKAAFTISVDSGPMHIAAALTAKLVSIHTWTDPRRVGPYNDGALVWKTGVVMRVGDFGNASPGKKSRSFRVADVREVLQAAALPG